MAIYVGGKLIGADQRSTSLSRYDPVEYFDRTRREPKPVRAPKQKPVREPNPLNIPNPVYESQRAERRSAQIAATVMRTVVLPYAYSFKRMRLSTFARVSRICFERVADQRIDTLAAGTGTLTQ